MNQDEDDMAEQYRTMAQMEANIRVKDNTGFDMEEYKEQLQQSEKEREQEEQIQKLRYRTKLKPILPEQSNSNSSHAVGASSRPEEPTLPFTRANRRYTKSGKGNNGRDRVPELCPGEVVPPNSNVGTNDHIAKCWGCPSGNYLKFNSLATLVQCPECLTVSPVIIETM